MARRNSINACPQCDRDKNKWNALCHRCSTLKKYTIEEKKLK